jgi:hypothetical protein
MINVFEATIEYKRLLSDPSWCICSVTIVAQDSEEGRRVIVSVTDAEDRVQFSTTVTRIVSAQLDTAKFESDRRIIVYDEPNDTHVVLRFTDRDEGRHFLMALLSAVARSLNNDGAVALAVNEDDVRARPGIGSPTETYNVTLHATYAMAVARENCDFVAEKRFEDFEGVGCCTLNGSERPTGDETTLRTLLSCSREGLNVMFAAEAGAIGRALPWLPSELLNLSDVILICLLTVHTIEGDSDVAKKESLHRRLQKQGATNVLGNIVLPKTPNSSFGAAARAIEAEPDEPAKTGKRKKKKSEVAEETVVAVESRTQAGDREPSIGVGDIVVRDGDDPPVDRSELLNFQVKLERKKQRVLKFEADVIRRHEEVEHQAHLNDIKEGEIQALRAAMEAERSQLFQQQDAFKLQQLRFYQQQQQQTEEDGSRGTKSKQGNLRSSKYSCGSEKEPLLIQGVDETFVLRLDHNFYDNTLFPPSMQRVYTTTVNFLSGALHPGGALAVLLCLIGAIALSALSLGGNSHSHLWPLVALFVMGVANFALLFYRKRTLCDGLHRIDQSCGQFETTVYILNRRTLFFLLPLAVGALTLCSLFGLLAVEVGVLGRAGVIMGAAGTVLSFGAVLVYFLLATSVSWDRVASTIPGEPGVLCTKLSLRQSMARYQYLKSVVAQVSRDWGPHIVLMAGSLLVIMGYCMYAAITDKGQARLFVYDALFSGSSLLLLGLLRSLSTWEGATLAVIGCIGTHVDRWSRGDHNGEADVRASDYVQLQQHFWFAVQGSNYAAWAIPLPGAPCFTVSKVWMYAAALLALLGFVTIPIAVLYDLRSLK